MKVRKSSRMYMTRKGDLIKVTKYTMGKRKR